MTPDVEPGGGLAHSLRLQLLRRLILPLLAMLLIAGIASYAFIIRPAALAYDQSLANAALAVAQYVTSRESGGLHFEFSHQAEQVLRTDSYDDIYFLVLDGQGRDIAGDHDLPPPPRNLQASEGWAGYDAVFHGKPVRAVVLPRVISGETVSVVVAETRNKRESLAWAVGLGMLVPEILAAAGVVAIVWFGVGRSLAPLARLREDLQARSHLDLRPLDESQVVDEVRPLLREFNELLHRLAAASQAQHRFIANAAHQLRTPLAGLQTQLELSLQETDDQARQTRLQQCRTATERTSRMVNQLLALCAVEPGSRPDAPLVSLDLALVLGEHADAWVHRAIARRIDFGLELASAPVQGDPLLLGELAGNLVDNALAYSTGGGHVTVRTGQRPEQAYYLEVLDNGPGIPASERERVLERFHRVPGTQGIGSGLGLAIVQEIALRHGAQVLIESGMPDGSGTSVKVLFPRPLPNRESVH